MTQPFEQQQNRSPSIFSANGRLGRLSYAAWSLFTLFIIAVVAGGGFSILEPMRHGDSSNAQLTVLVLILIAIPIFYVTVVLGIKRLHDINKVGWLFLLNFVPLVSFFFTFYLLYAKGTQGPNTYGPVPTTKTWHKVLGWPTLAMPIVIGFAAIASIIYSSTMTPTSVTEISKETTYIEQKIASEPVASLVKGS
ncbi:DUF805 domain-containing protein [Acinetobacter rathckeae]|uniref:DUF805 domain-containing protein n=1 Tax=Acinetobacter rathckeae TaxID=2605272 RepID=UPI0018A27DB5|nr:DUF805 domain-containing protein [Acinetobacter rathckeae]MBF7688677.1 DUF805 domain-containing protein [Acinetobacter rathckeae]